MIDFSNSVFRAPDFDKNGLPNLTNAVLLVSYISGENQENLWREGSAFIISYKNHSFLITANHCIQKENLKNLFICSFFSSKTKHSIPLKEYLVKDCDKGIKVDSDIAVFVINDQAIINNIVNFLPKSSDDYAYELLATPFFKDLKKRYKNNPTKMKKKLLSSKLYNTFDFRRKKENFDAIKEADTSLVNMCSFEIASNDFSLKKGVFCNFYGYPSQKGKMDYDDNGNFCGGSQTFLTIQGFLTGEYYENTDTYVLKYDNDEDLNGFSGGPVVYDGKVIGVITEIEENLKQLKFVSFKSIVKILEYYINLNTLPSASHNIY